MSNCAATSTFTDRLPRKLAAVVAIHTTRAPGVRTWTPRARAFSEKVHNFYKKVPMFCEKHGDFLLCVGEGAYETSEPGSTSRSGVMTASEPSALSAERIMPWLTRPFLKVRGARLAMKQTCLPTSCSGS